MYSNAVIVVDRIALCSTQNINLRYWYDLYLPSVATFFAFSSLPPDSINLFPIPSHHFTFMSDRWVQRPMTWDSLCRHRSNYVQPISTKYSLCFWLRSSHLPAPPYCWSTLCVDPIITSRREAAFNT